ncbi:2-C-methyl-D-erythritol 4-phosphate cytidylyltransferase [Puniceicoccus vermicola]|uniref:2-C-methyl-D-erythritol 4-phosphate cytidylyltransferase n=1 Tax=Puniceicoccus vermicola TaxID=388746 RepID=A0A7X1E4G9_9BACT|nr:2-C-methyl-D-erythritol 4-phosphate cytidylyltransferase [Puniceicoccus vermicola]MBC2600607.1 2-C-methyl-D-erythritol 4-phosphate cytidylyltransferase [Puniceicoccus vermicola]
MMPSHSRPLGSARPSGVRAILLAAGKGTRMKGAVDDKILVPIEGKSSFRRSFDTFLSSAIFDGIVVVYRDLEQKERLAAELADTSADGDLPPVKWAQGGSLRQDSVFEGLATAGIDTEYAFIHDCARPLVKAEDIERLFERVVQDKAASLARPVTDTIKRVNRRRTNSRKCVLKEIDRRGCWSMETPQAFEYNLIFDAYQKARQDTVVYTDDTSVASAAGVRITLVEPSFPNPKITRPGDLALAAFLVRNPDLIQKEPE